MSSTSKLKAIGLKAVVPILIVAAGYGGLVAFGRRDVEKSDDTPTKRVTYVETTGIETFNGAFRIRIEGEAIPHRVVTVSAEVGGRVVGKNENCRGGSYVAEGTTLFQLDDSDYRLEVERLAAQLRQANEEIAAAGIDLENSRKLELVAAEEWELERKQLERIKSLFDRDTASQSEFDAARRQELTARNSLQTITNQIRAQLQKVKTLAAACDLVDARKRRSESDLSRTKVVARTNGSIVDDLVEQGNYVKAGDVLVHISDSSRMEVKCDLRVDELAWVWLQARAKPGFVAAGMESRVELPPTPVEVVFRFQGSELVWNGILSRYEGTGLDEDTRTAPCRVLIAEPAKARLRSAVVDRPAIAPPALLSGMYVSIEIPIRSPTPLLQMPIDAVRPGGRVWLVRDGKLQIVEIDIARTEGEFVLVRNEAGRLRPTDRVVTSPLASVRNAMPVQDVTESKSEVTDS